mmetsp:Transcript_1206/g.1430  ORF Transcript_1206/g.1430 Transcript_1206/m.1430 type:complete len:296 (+) Transcript_1206:253-1140(+)
MYVTAETVELGKTAEVVVAEERRLSDEIKFHLDDMIRSGPARYLKEKLSAEDEEQILKNPGKVCFCLSLFLFLLITIFSTLAATAAVASGGALLDGRFNVTVEREDYLPLAAKLGALQGSLFGGVVLLVGTIVSCIVHPMSKPNVPLYKQILTGICLLNLAILLGLIIPYILATYTDTDPKDVYCAVGIQIGLEFAGGCLFNDSKEKKKESKDDEDEEDECRKGCCQDNDDDNSWIGIAKWAWQIVIAVVIYKALTNKDRLPDIDGMLPVSCLFGLFYCPGFVVFLPVFYPQAFA